MPSNILKMPSERLGDEIPAEENTDAKSLTRREVIDYTIKNLLITLPFLALGVKSCVVDFWDSNKTEEEMIKRGYKKDVVTGNYLNPKSKVFAAVQALDRHEKPKGLVAVKDSNGNTMYDIEKRPVLMRPIAAKKLTLADKLMYKAIGKHIKIRSSFRKNVAQNKINTGQNIQSAPPGSSFHEAGLAVDVKNWAEAQYFLVRVGLVGGMYTNNTVISDLTRNGEAVKKRVKFRNVDANHFSVGGELDRDITLADGVSDWSYSQDEAGECTKVLFRMTEFDTFNKKWDSSISYKDATSFLGKLVGRLFNAEQCVENITDDDQ